MIVRVITHWLVSSAVVFIPLYFLPGIHVKDFSTALIIASVLGFLNLFLRRPLVLLRLPTTFLTVGLFSIIFNALLILLATTIVPGLKVDGLLWAGLFGLAISFIKTVIGRFSRIHI